MVKHFPTDLKALPRSYFVRFLLTGVRPLPCPDIKFTKGQITDEHKKTGRTHAFSRGLTYTHEGVA